MTGKGADLHLGVLLGVVLLGQRGAQPAEEEGQRDGDQSGVVQRNLRVGAETPRMISTTAGAHHRLADHSDR